MDKSGSGTLSYENINKAYIYRVIDGGGKKVGGILRCVSGDEMRLNLKGLQSLSLALKRSKAKLSNARVNVDGDITALPGCAVKDIKLESLTRKSLAESERAKSGDCLDESQKSAQYAVVKSLKARVGKIEHEYLPLLVRGLALAKKEGIACSARMAEYNKSFDKGTDWYVRVRLINEKLGTRYESLYAYLYIDGHILLELSDEIVSDNCGLNYMDWLMPADRPDLRIVCHSPQDITFALAYFYKSIGDTLSYDRHSELIDELMSDPSQRRISAYSGGLRIGGVAIKRRLSEHFPALKKVCLIINDRLSGMGMTALDFRDDGKTAEISIGREDDDGSLCSIRIELSNRQGLECADVLYKLGTRVLPDRLTGQWVRNETYVGLTHIDSVAYAVLDVAKRVMSMRIFRRTIEVMAYSDDGKFLASIDGKIGWISEVWLNNNLDTWVVLGVGMRREKFLDEFGSAYYKWLVVPGQDKYGNPLSKCSIADDDIIIERCLTFYDMVGGAYRAVYVNLSLNAYKRLSAAEHAATAKVQPPVKMLTEVLYGNASVKALAAALQKAAREYRYSSAETVVFIQNFVQSLVYVELADDLHRNRSALEVLLEGCGHCLEKSALEASILSYIGYESAVLFRYSPSLSTRFHCVGGVRLPMNDVINAGFAYDDGAPSAYSFCSVNKYLGLETLGRSSLIGVAKEWYGNSDSAVRKLPPDKTDRQKPYAKHGQALAVSIGLKDGRPSASEVAYYPNGSACWEDVALWFN